MKPILQREGAGIVYELVMQTGKVLLSGNANHGRSSHPDRMPQSFYVFGKIYG